MISTKVIPVANNMLVRCFKENKQETKSGLVVVKQDELWNRNFLECEILAVGKDVKDYRVGQIVLIKGHDGDWLNPDFFTDTNEYLYRMIEQDLVHAILEQVDVNEHVGLGVEVL